MKKKYSLMMVVVFAGVLLTTGMAAAAKYPNLVGTWSGPVYFVGWDESGGFFNATFVFSYNIQSEDPATGNFLGLRNGFFPFTGHVSTNKTVTLIEYGASGDYRILTAKVTRTTISGTMQHFLPGHIDTGTFTLKKE